MRLGVDYVDALLLHRPDTLMEPSEVAEAFDILKTSGKVISFPLVFIYSYIFPLGKLYLPMASYILLRKVIFAYGELWGNYIRLTASDISPLGKLYFDFQSKLYSPNGELYFPFGEVVVGL